MKTFTVLHGSDLTKGAAAGSGAVYLCADLDPTGGLQVSDIPQNRGGLLGVYAGRGLPLIYDPKKLARELEKRCRKAGLGGVLLDLPAEGPGAMEFAQKLCPYFVQAGMVHYLPIELAAAAPQAKLILPSAISGGSFAEMLRVFSGQYPPGRLCLELIRTRNDFTMPSPNADGLPLSRADFDALYEKAGSSYYAKELTCRYFTYLDGDTPHFVMYDDEQTAREKLRLAREAGFFAAFALYSEWGGEDLQKIFSI